MGLRAKWEASRCLCTNIGRTQGLTSGMSFRGSRCPLLQEKTQSSPPLLSVLWSLRREVRSDTGSDPERQMENRGGVASPSIALAG